MQVIKRLMSRTFESISWGTITACIAHCKYEDFDSYEIVISAEDTTGIYPSDNGRIEVFCECDFKNPKGLKYLSEELDKLTADEAEHNIDCALAAHIKRVKNPENTVPIV